MWLLALSCLLSSQQFAASVLRDNEDCGVRYDVNRYEPTIANGLETKHNEYPWHVALYKLFNGTYSYICGGTIIQPRVILTAAHCVYVDGISAADDSEIFVITGKYHRSWDIRDPGEHRFKVIGKKYPVTYSGPGNRYADDIALLALNESISFNDLVMPICLDRAGLYHKEDISQAGLTWANWLNIDYYENIFAIVGWGTNENNSLSDTLMLANLEYFNFTSCRAEVSEGFITFVTSDKFCAESSNEGMVGQGDSGGAFVFPHINNNHQKQYYIYGVLSTKDVNTTTIATFTNVTFQMAWINNTLMSIKAENQVKEVCGKRYKVNYIDSTGENITSYGHPWLATIYYVRHGEFFGVRCVGNIIHQKAILTSASCVEKIPGVYQPADFKVLVGKHTLNMSETEKYEQRLDVHEINVHELYKRSGLRNEHDLAIMVLQGEMKFTNSVVPICIDWRDELSLYNRSLALGTIVSWDTKECHCQVSASYKCLSKEQCRKDYGKTEGYLNYVSPDKLCVTYENGTVFSDGSDIGAGLIYSNSTKPGDGGIHYIYAVVTQNRPTSEEFMTFTNISLDLNLEWIKRNLDLIPWT